LAGNRTGRLTLHAHGVVYLSLGVLSSGLAAAAWRAFVGSTEGPAASPDPAGIAIWLAAAFCWVLQARSGLASEVTGPARIPRFGAALPVLLGAGWLAVTVLGRVAGGGSAAMAVSRSAVLAITAVVLALAARRTRWSELGWPVVPLLALGCVKLLVEDMRRGSPVTLTIALALLGTALILAPRLLLAARREQGAPEASPDSEASCG
jgi:hypothetical protein